MSFWRRTSLLILYLFLIVISSWILEWILFWEAGYFTYHMVAPLQDLSVAKLQALLDKRGILHDELIEKKELVESLQQSGPVQYIELLSAFSTLNPKAPVDITGSEEYYEQLSDESESVWLLEIIPEKSHYSDHQILDESALKSLQRTLQPLGIYMGKVHCIKDPWLCKDHGWLDHHLTLVIPKHPHGDVKASLLCTPGKKLAPKTILSWLKKELYSLTKKIDTLEELESLALNTTVSKEREISQVIFISELLSPPLLLMTLGLRFSSRINFSSFTIKKSDREQVLKLLKRHKISSPPSIVFTSSESVTAYGNKKGEIFSLKSFENYIKFHQPKINDVFLVSLLLANLLAFLETLDARGKMWKHLIKSLLCFPMYNIIVFLLWLSLSAAIKFPWMSPCISTGQYLVQKFSAYYGSTFAYYLTLVDFFVGLNVSTLFIFAVTLYGYHKYRSRSSENSQHEESDDSWYTLFSMDSYIVNVLFRPMASLSRPRPSHDLGLEEGMELLIERLATPDLWLHPVVPTDYIKNLPVWRYDGWGNEEDLKSESETDWDSLSDNENDNILWNHSCCQDASCKMCILWTTVKETYVCHRCAILKRKLERQFLTYKNLGENFNGSLTYERLLKVCDNCLRTQKKQLSLNFRQNNKKNFVQENLFPSLFQNLTWSAPAYAIESRVCAICLDKYRWSAVLCGLPCGHTYHHSCIIEWLSKDNHHCPTCRWPSYRCKANSNDWN